MNDHAYLYANTSDKSIIYDLAARCALVEVPPVPGGGLKRIPSSFPSPPASLVKWLQNQLLPHPCALVGPAATPATVGGMKLGEVHTGRVGRGRVTVGRAVGVLEHPRM